MVAAIVFIFGLLVGSFLNVCIYRLPRNESLVFPASHCPGCGTAIPPWLNIPVVSYLLLRGRCRSCAASISAIYPLVELLTAFLGLLLYLRFGLTLPFFILALLCAALVVVTFIDLEHQIIPDEISLPGIVIGFACSFFIPRLGWLNSLLGILAGGGSLYLVAWGYERLTGKEGMGGGDIKLLAMLGAFFGWKAIPFIILVSSLTGSIIGITLMLVRKQDGKLAIPFGPFLVIGTLVHIFFGRQIVAWYLNLFPGGGGAT
jgi:leader peptidase (prepilin peptidase)/N-methyltransferase